MELFLCESLTSITIPNSVTSIGEDAFHSCELLTSITISDSVTSIGDHAFSDCHSLVDITIPSSVTSIGDYAFGNCKSLTTIYGYKGSYAETYAKENSIQFVVLKGKDIRQCTVDNIKDQVYTGKALKPTVTVKDGSKTLKNGTDYTVEYKDNINVGTGKAIIMGKGNYNGSVTKNFAITKASEGDNGSPQKCLKRLLGSKDNSRLYGTSRYQTAIKAADGLKKSAGVSKFDNIIVACGDNYPDALTGSYLAKVKKAPILLVDKSTGYEKSIKDYITKNLKKGGTVYILGGENAVTKRFEKSISSFNVKRLYGAGRYDTNIAILKAAGVTNQDILVCTGEGFADSLSASAAGKPILLAGSSGISQKQITYLKSLKKGNIYLIGGNKVVRDNIGKQLKAYDKDGKVERVSGANRYKTSTAVAKKFFPGKCEAAVFAYAGNFPDGLSGGPLAMSLDSPLILTDNSGYAEAKAYSKAKGINKAIVLGGERLISDSVVNKILN